MFKRHFMNTGVNITNAISLTVHDHTPMRQLVHRADGQPTTPVKELALLIGHVFPQARGVIEYPAVQRDVMAAGDDLQRIKLQVIYRLHSLLRTLDAAPAPTRPQALLAEDE